MLVHRGVVGLGRAADMAGDTLAAVEDRHRGRGQEDVEAAVHQRVRHRVEMAVDGEVVIDVDASDEPAADDEGCLRQRLQLGPLDRLEQRAAAALARRRERPVVPFLDLLGNRGVGLGEREELAMAQRRQHPHLDHFYRILRGRLVAWAPHPRRDNGDTVVPRQLVVAAVQHRIPVEGVGDAGLEIVRDQLGGTAADIGEGADMGTEPVILRLTPARFGIGQVRARQTGDEDLRRARDAGLDHGERHAGIIDLERLAGTVQLAHRRRPGALLPSVKTAAELGVAIAARVAVQILAPKQAQRHPAAAQLLLDFLPIRQRAIRIAVIAGYEQTAIELLLAQLLRRFPAQPGRRGPVEIFLGRRARHLGTPRHRRVAQPERMLQPKNFLDPPHRRPRSGHVRAPDKRRDDSPRLLAAQQRCRGRSRVPKTPKSGAGLERNQVPL